MAARPGALEHPQPHLLAEALAHHAAELADSVH